MAQIRNAKNANTDNRDDTDEEKYKIQIQIREMTQMKRNIKCEHR